MDVTRTYRTRIHAAHPMLKNHRVFGTPVLPGLAYIDLLYQLASAALRVEVTAYALRRLAIHAPLAIEDGDVAELAVGFARTDGGWRIEVRRTGSSDTLLVNAELQSNAPPPDAQLDLDEFKASSTQRIDLQRIYDAAGKRGLNHSGPMLPEGEIFVRGLDRLVRLRVREKVDAQHLIWHPALIDGAAMATESLRDESDATLYLPLFYDRFSARAPFDDECHALIRGGQVRGVHEITTLDIDFFDARGRQVAALHGMTSKRVRAPEQITRAAVPLNTGADAAAVGDTLRAIVAARLGMPAGSVEPSAGFFSLGLQSSQLLGIVADIEKALAISLSPTLLFEHANLNEVRGHLLGVLAGRPASRLPTQASALPPAQDYVFNAADRLVLDHRVYGRPALMGIVHPCLALHAVAHERGSVARELRRIVFHGGPISLEATESLRLHVEWSRGEDGIVFQVLRQPQGDLCCEGRLAPETPPAHMANLAELWSVASALSEEQLERVYGGVSAFELGASFRTIERAARLADGSLIIRVKLADGYSMASADTTYPLDPRMLAACYFLYDEQAAKPGESAVPVPLAIESLVLHRRVPPTASIVTTVHTVREDLQVFDATVYDEDGSVVAQVRNASLRLVRNQERLVGRWSQQNNEPQAAGAGIAVAVIGLSGRYPQATDLDVFWRNLVNGRDCISEIPRARWDWRAYYSAEGRAPGKITSKWGGFIDDVDRFAPLFFSIAPREAACMDPQERLFLEESWNALEDAGYTRAALGAGTVGVYVGVMSQEYPLYALEPHAGAGGVGIASGIGTIANRVSYCFDLRGPSMAVDTMCSSSLTAISLACEALHARSIDAALAGGVNVSIHPNKYLMLAQGGFLSTAGRCGSFGEGAAGYVPGEGVGVAILKRLDDALRDGDQVYGVIRGIATNHGGRASGYAVPNPRAQFEVIRRAWKQAGLRPEQLSYVEAHGTGTALGDPIEIEGLTRAVREYTSAQGFCAIGSVKSNIGHLESAAGIAALTKVLLQMRHGMLVPSLHCEVLNPNIDFERSPFLVQREAAAWPRRRDVSAGNREIARIAAVSSFGAGGSNAHLVVEELVVPEATAPLEPVLIVLSARTAEELQGRARSLLEALRRRGAGESDLTRIAWTLQVGREAMDERLAFVVESLDQLQALLAGWLEGVTTHVARGRVGESAAVSLFTQDDDLAPAVEAWVTARRLGKLAQLWVHGGVIDWARLYAPHPPRRISLPGYPFTRQRCWIGDTGVGTTQPRQFDPIVFSERWIPAGAAEATWSPSTCLLFAQDRKQLSALHAAVRQRWPAAMVHVALAAHADAPGIDPPLAGLRDRGERLDIVIYWSESADRPAYSALRLALRSLIHSGLPPRRFVLAGRAVTNTVAACHLEAYEALLRSVRPLLGDAEIGTVFLDDEEWLARLATEASVARLQAVRWRGGERLLREFAAQALPATLPSPFKAGGTYLITGGLGALGYAVAHYLASASHAHLVLVGRSPLESERAARLEALRAFGVRVCYLCCDVADATALHDALAQNGVAGSIRGVVHAAGISEPSTLADCDDSRFEAVLAPKIAGTLALDEALADEPLDFICYFSSVAAVLGDFGLGAYAAGNRFQVAFARQPAKDGVRRIAIQWPLWREGGMALGNAEGQVLYLASSGQHALSTGKAMELLPRLIASGDPAPVVLCGDPARMRAMLEPEHALRAATNSPPPAAVVPPGEWPAGLSLRERIEHDLKGLVSRLLQIELANIERGANFADFGFDSMSLQDFARQLGEHYGLEIPPAVLFDHPSIERLAGHLLATVPSAGQASADTGESPNGQDAEPRRPGRDEPVPIAIIGMSGRFPKARNVEEMWRTLCEGHDAIEEIPPERFDVAAVFQPGAVVPDKTNCKWSGILPGADEFDPLFFEISPREAAQIDPRQRLLLQEAYRALEDAGLGPQQLARGPVGVFVGAESGAYQDVSGEKVSITANHEAVLAARLSHFLDLSGPSMVINTACSSGLVALHQACVSLSARECDGAVVAAVNLLLAPESFIGMSQAGILSPDGRCYSFDTRANGIVPGEAVVALVLKRLRDALADRDPIYALVRGSGVNQDGRTNGLTAPSGRAQRNLLQQVYERCGVDCGQIESFMAHGTATRLGDHIELRALTEAFAARGQPRGRCALTSTKPTFGHTFAASGLLSVVAMVQSMRHGLIPRSLHCENESADARGLGSFFFVNQSSLPWPRTPGRPRLGAVSAFGMSGTNAHAVLESWDDEPARGVRACYPLALSGKSDAALRRRAADLAEWLHGQPAEAVSLGIVADTLLHGRHHHRHRAMLIVDDREAALAALERFARMEVVEDAFSGVVDRELTPEATAQARADELAKLAAHLDDATRLKAVLRELAQYYCAGVTPRLPKGRDGSAVQRAHLPAYSFERERYWIARREVRGPTPPPADPIAAGTPLVEQVIQRVLDHLGVSSAQVGPDDPLDELGLDSIGAMRLLTTLRELVPQTAESLFLEYPTLAGLRRYFTALESDVRSDAPRPDAHPLQPSGQGEAAEPASLVGLAGLFPEARNLAELWNLLTERRVVTGPLPASRRELVGLPADAPLRHGAFLEHVECFDRERFRMSREEACAADPQLRKLIEVVWQAVANSGYTLKDFRTRTTGVFVATPGHSGYREIPAFTARGEPLASAESPALYANRLSNLFDLKGPSTVVDAGCAGFLVALEAAVAALRSGRCEQAIVATAQLYLSPHELGNAEPGPLYSKGIRTRSFAHDSDGYLRSEAVGALVLKLRDRAVSDGDAIYANVLGAGAWHGGKSPLKWYSPNVQGQRMAIRQAFEQARIPPQTVDYIEAEANGSQLGDASEIMAIQGEYAMPAPDCARSQASGPIYIGSLKPLLGHAEAAATFHALTKVVLSLQHRRLPGTPDPGEINPGIHLEPGFALLLETREWHRAGHPRRAAVHSLSVGGVNAHVLLEEAAPPARSADEPSAHIFVFSALAPDLLRETVGKMLAVLEGEGVALNARDVAATLQLGRDAESCRLAVIAADLTTLCAHLRQWCLGSGTPGELLGTGASEPQKVLARSWVEGARINWHSQLGSKPWRRVHLPPPELRREVCWHGGLGERRLPGAEMGDDAFGPVLLRPRWVAQPLRMDEPSAGTSGARRMTVFCDWPAYRFESFRRQATESDGVRTVACKAAALLPDRFGVYSRALFGLVKELLAELHEERALVQVVLPSGLDQLGLHGLVGLLRTATREHSRFRGQLIVIDRDMDAAEAICALRTIAREPRADYVQLCDRNRWTQTWDLVRPEELLACGRAVPEPGGESPVLLITGGSGGIGMDLAEHILQSHPRVQVVLAGRSPHSPRAQRIAQLQEQTGRLHYLSADLGCQREVHSLIERTLKCCARLTGIVHCAGVTHDGAIAGKSVGEIDAVLLPKVSGLFYLDEATKELPLQFLVAFSSLSSLRGNPGQAGYCMANAFMDTFAAYRNQLVCLGERSGRTLSINWPLWRDGGMKMSEEVERHLAQEHGMLPLPSPVGFDLLLALLNGPAAPQVAVKYGHVARLIDDHVNQGGL